MSIHFFFLNRESSLEGRSGQIIRPKTALLKGLWESLANSSASDSMCLILSKSVNISVVSVFPSGKGQG